MAFIVFLENIFDDDFDIASLRKEIQARGPVVHKEIVTRNKMMTLYHGFNTNPEEFNYQFDPSKSEQGLIWFTHAFIRGYDPQEYASNRGDYLLTYELPIKSYTEVVTYQNGQKGNQIPETFRDLVDPLKNSRFIMNFDEVIELPKGWFFTYKSEKFIGTTNVIQASPHQVTRT